MQFTLMPLAPTSTAIPLVRVRTPPFQSATARSAPSAAKRRAVPRPIPEAAPVTTAILPSNLTPASFLYMDIIAGLRPGTARPPTDGREAVALGAMEGVDAGGARPR